MYRYINSKCIMVLLCCQELSVRNGFELGLLRVGVDGLSPFTEASDLRPRMNAKNFLLRLHVAEGFADGARDFAPRPAGRRAKQRGEDTLGLCPGSFMLMVYDERVSAFRSSR